MESAATLFHEPFRRPGWRTDRGRILVKYGRPSQRTVRAGDLDSSASELWEYESPRRVFFFVDDRGSGEFWLRT
jgi:GWxTD domain-containing protein